MDTYKCGCGSNIKLFPGQKSGIICPKKLHFQTTKHQLWERKHQIDIINKFLSNLNPPEKLQWTLNL